MPIPQTDPALCGLAWATKVCASGYFHTGRDPVRTFRESCNWMAASDEVVRAAVKERNTAALIALMPEFELDAAAGTLAAHLGGNTAHVRRAGDQGIVVTTGPEERQNFEPVAVPRSTYTGIKTPLDVPGVIPEPGKTGAQAAAIVEAGDSLFANPRQMTNAFLVLHRGALLYERYREPFGPETAFESWSMGKTLAATLFGVGVQNGAVSLDEDQLFAAWRGASDPRTRIRARDLLNMASGLSFTGSYGQSDDTSIKQENGRFLDHIYVYAGGVDSHAFCLDKPLADTPGTSGRYRNCDPLLIMGLLRERLYAGSIPPFLTWPYEALLNRIGATGMILETDPYGHFLISGHDYGRARDWARIGQLHLQRGAWGGEQIIPESYCDFMQTPALEAWGPDQAYGGFCYLNRDHIIKGLPADAMIMSGGGRQRVIVVPSRDLVMVRLGHINGQTAGLDQSLETAYAAICCAIDNAKIG